MGTFLKIVMGWIVMTRKVTIRVSNPMNARGEVAKHNVTRFEIQSDSNLRVVERTEADDDEIAIEQEKN